MWLRRFRDLCHARISLVKGTFSDLSPHLPFRRSGEPSYQTNWKSTRSRGSKCTAGTLRRNRTVVMSLTGHKLPDEDAAEHGSCSPVTGPPSADSASTSLSCRNASRAPTHQWPCAEPSKAIGADLADHSVAANRLAFGLVTRRAEASAPARTRCRQHRERLPPI